jgi:hypothetical protein
MHSIAFIRAAEHDLSEKLHLPWAIATAYFIDWDPL